ncbi:type IV secretory system conjugative DNA transfer family protein [Desulfovibrio sp. JC010]|uniref:type IV secretory system conjugative DNA transfer family protein n=1 Tax=Desulfovibrio sp. JC010 TaxID=2593641 RepID=UPI0013D69A27|nr:type IV secretory system conjugative DNA transfer family protein [Desulfovibrio sp. JC010]NDV28058.1 hypothetical protein [Desulfovibrio sp. JC010]
MVWDSIKNKFSSMANNRKKLLELNERVRPIVEELKENEKYLDEDVRKQVGYFPEYTAKEWQCNYFIEDIDIDAIRDTIKKKKEEEVIVNKAMRIVNQLKDSADFLDSSLSMKINAFINRPTFEASTYFIEELDYKNILRELPKLKRKFKEQQFRQKIEQYDGKANAVSIVSGDCMHFDANYRQLRGKNYFEFYRTLSDFNQKEIASLKLLEVFSRFGLPNEEISQSFVSEAKLAIVYNRGNCIQSFDESIDASDRIVGALNHVVQSSQMSGQTKQIATNITKISSKHMKVADVKAALGEAVIPSKTACSLVLSAALRIQEKLPNDSCTVYINEILGSANSWLNSRENKNSKISFVDSKSESKKISNSLLLGKNSDGSYAHYCGEGSLLTIAHSGAGKTQSNAILNLMRYNGPSIVLDIKGTCYASSAEWREVNVGKTYRFSPFDKESSCKINPLDRIRRDINYVVEDSMSLASMLIVIQNSNNPTWDIRARQVVASSIACLVLDPEIENPTMQDVQDVLAFNGDEWVDFRRKMYGAGDFEVPKTLERDAKIFGNIPDDQFATIIDTAREQVASWDVNSIANATEKTNFDPSSFRNGKNATLYITLTKDELKMYASVIRVILASLINPLMKEIPSDDVNDLILFLDEFPLLGQMDPIDDALSLGREYKIKLWFFSQTEGSIHDASKTPGLIADNCDVHIYMTPAPNTAERLSRQLGVVESIADGQQKPLVTPQELTGEEFSDKALVLTKGCKPMKLEKVMAYQFY